MQQKETERADDRIDEEFYEELSEEEIQDEIASLYRRRGYMDAETLNVSASMKHYAESTARYG